MIHIPINVLEGEGIDLEKLYKVGSYFPVFILTDSSASVIGRWTGFSQADRFLTSFRKAAADLTTVEKRKKRLKTDPSFKDAYFMAEYSADTGDYLNAVDYYRQAGKLSNRPNIDYSYEIFENTANAVWNDKIEFEALISAADSVIFSGRKSSSNIIKAARIFSGVARRKEETDRIEKYLRAGLDAVSTSRDKKLTGYRADFEADLALYGKSDTTSALRIKKTSLGAGWENNPDKYYRFADWCLERKINLVEAESLARKAMNKSQPGKFKGKILNTLGQICYERGNIDEAVSMIQQAVNEDPANDDYFKRLLEYKKQRGD